MERFDVYLKIFFLSKCGSSLAAWELFPFMCFWRCPFWVALYWQCVQWNFWPSWIDFTCFWRSPFSVALYWQCVHGNLCPSWTDFMCFWRFPLSVNVDPQCVHGKFWPSWCDFFCFWRFPLSVNVDPQCVQANFWSSWIDLKAYLMSKCGSTMFAWKYLAFLPSCSDFLCLLKTPNYNANRENRSNPPLVSSIQSISLFHYLVQLCNPSWHPTQPTLTKSNPTKPNLSPDPDMFFHISEIWQWWKWGPVSSTVSGGRTSLPVFHPPNQLGFHTQIKIVPGWLKMHWLS